MSTKTLTSRQYAERLIERSHREPNNVDLHISIGEACLRNGDTDGAFKAFNRAAELDPSSYFRSLVYEWSGYINKKAGKISEAVTAYNQWAQIDRASSYPLDRWGAVLAQGSMTVDLFLLRSMYKKRLEQAPEDPELRASLALLSFVLGENFIDEETSLLQLTSSALEAEYDSLPMRYLMGLLFMRIAHFDSADSEFKKVIELDPEKTWQEYRFGLNWSSESATLMRARIAHIQKRYDDALNLCLCSAVQLNKLDPFKLFEEMISIVMEMEDYLSALTFIKETIPEYILELAPPSVHRMIARCELGVGKISAAAERYKKIEAESEPDKVTQNVTKDCDTSDTPSKDEIAAAVARTSLEAELLCDSGEYDKAIESWDKLCNAYPDLNIPEACMGKAKAMICHGDYKGATNTLEHFLDACQTDQVRNLELWNQLASLYKQLGETIKYRLARVQIQSMFHQEEESFDNEIIAIPSSSVPIIALGISARAIEGNGDVKVTGTNKVTAAVEIAWTNLRAEARNLELPDPNSYDIHIHIRDISFDVNKRLNILSEYLEGSKIEDGDWGNGEELGLAFLLAMVSALTGSSGGPLCVVGGRLDLQGRIYSSPQLTSGLQRMYEAGVRWKRLILPRSINADMEHIPQSVWLTSNLTLCSNARQAVRAWQFNS
ncbi:MAG: tetratricopeptide repeat protein [Candidatus Bruticola sp.]